MVHGGNDKLSDALEEGEWSTVTNEDQLSLGIAKQPGLSGDIGLFSESGRINTRSPRIWSTTWR